MKYPPEVASLGIQGTVIVQFIVTKTGKLDNLKVVRGVHPLLDKEALRVLKMMPVWTPGKQGGKPVNVYYTLPFKFVLGKKEATNSTDEKPFASVEQMPEFPGGQEEMMNFITKNMNYPPEASAKKIQGTVITQFIVRKTGKLTNYKVVRGVNPLLDEEALRVLKLMPEWTPGKQGGKPVDVYYTLPFRFTLN
jgi:TonB family protein